jgi:hypothetical protein
VAGALGNAAFFAYANNYLIDVEHGIVVDVEASWAIRLSDVCASQTMIEGTEACLGLKPDWLVAGHGLRLCRESRLAGRGEGHRTPHPSHRQAALSWNE